MPVRPAITLRRLLRLLPILVIAGAAGWALVAGDDAAVGIREFTEHAGPWAAPCFIAAYVIATLLLIPGGLLTLAAGALFGLWKGLLIASLASILGATGSFVLARGFLRAPITNRFGAHPRFAALDRAVRREGWRIVVLTRLSPLFPFTFLNYAFGLTDIPLRHYVPACVVGMLPGTLLFVHAGTLAHASPGSNPESGYTLAFKIAGLVATLAVTLMVCRMAKQAAGRHLPQDEGATP